jgi:NAD(P)-dependent dehydrogenase (short-subunit alcohol dehydrogenase family)
VSKVLVTGSADGLGQIAAQQLVAGGHEVVLHARDRRRAEYALNETPGAADALVGDLASIGQTQALAEAANAAGRFDAVIHNAGVGYRGPRIETGDGLEHVFAINVLAPYLLTTLMTPPDRLVYLTSGMHRGGDPALDDPQWEHRAWRGSQAYSDAKLFDLTLALAVARRWPDVRSNAVSPGWVPTKMGGAGAPDDLVQGALTQAWLAVSDEPAALVSGGYFFHKQPQQPHPAARSPEAQDALTDYCGRLSGIALPA